MPCWLQDEVTVQIKKLIAVTLASIFCLSSSIPVSAAEIRVPRAALPVIDWTIPSKNTFPHCETSTQLDCVESVSVFDSAGNLHPASWQVDSYQPTFTDQLGNINNLGQSTWVATVDGRQLTVGISANAESPTHACCKFDNGTIKRFGSIRASVNVDQPLTTKVQFSTFRFMPLRLIFLRWRLRVEISGPLLAKAYQLVATTTTGLKNLQAIARLITTRHPSTS
jgi:hypothetical protein